MYAELCNCSQAGRNIGISHQTVEYIVKSHGNEEKEETRKGIGSNQPWLCHATWPRIIIADEEMAESKNLRIDPGRDVFHFFLFSNHTSTRRFNIQISHTAVYRRHGRWQPASSILAKKQQPRISVLDDRWISQTFTEFHVV